MADGFRLVFLQIVLGVICVIIGITIADLAPNQTTSNNSMTEQIPPLDSITIGGGFIFFGLISFVGGVGFILGGLWRELKIRT